MDDNVRAVCVIGWPVKHSRSPIIHKYWLEQHGIAGDYLREAVAPEDFPDFVRDLAGRGYVGANVTLPHKEAALRLSQADERARAVGAANTLWLRDGELCATNTDVEGFIDNLDAAAPAWDWNLHTALVLGAGGGARAVLFGLLQRGVGRILLANRTEAKASALAREFGSRVHVLAWRDAPAALSDCGLLVNTTSLGMAGQPPLDLALRPLPPEAIVADLVYAPLETDLLKKARAQKLRTVDGLGMLLHQAVRGFSLWFQITPAVTPELRSLLERDLAR